MARPTTKDMTTAPSVRFLDRATAPHIATLILLTGISALTMNVFLPSLPNMTAYFDTEYRLMQLSVAVYLGVNAVLQILIGPISDKMGRRPVILWGMALFLLATLGCIFAPTAYIFLVFRMMQAVVVVGMVLGRAVVRDMYPQDKAASMIGYVTMGMAVVPMIGPAIGGVLDGLFGWQANFWLLFVLGLAMLWLTWTDLGETSRASGKTLVQQFREYPELLTSPRFWGYALAAAFSSGAFFTYLGGAPFVGSEVFGLTPTLLGIYFGAPAVGYFLGNFISRAVLHALRCQPDDPGGRAFERRGHRAEHGDLPGRRGHGDQLFRADDLRRPRQWHDHPQRDRRGAVGAPAPGGHGVRPVGRDHAGRWRCAVGTGGRTTGTGNRRFPAVVDHDADRRAGCGRHLDGHAPGKATRHLSTLAGASLQSYACAAANLQRYPWPPRNSMPGPSCARRG